jgi:hypothetical protein
LHPRFDRKIEEVQCPTGGFARGASRSHRDRHRTLNFVHVEVAGGVAVGDPGLLHRAQLCGLLVIQYAHQVLEVLVEKVVPDHPFDAITVCRAEIGRTFPRIGAWCGDQIEHTVPLALVHVILIFARAVPDRRHLLHSWLARLRVYTGQWQSRHQDRERQENSGSHVPHRVFSKISRPINMRRISLVPAPIS